jgi:TonB family protein
MKINEAIEAANEAEGRDIFTTGTSISESNAWFKSLFRQIRENLAERRNPTPKAEITAERDPSALDKLVNPPSQISSLYSVLKSIINDKRHPHHIETTAAPVEVEEIWSKRKMQVPGLLSLVVHVGVVGTLIYLSTLTISKPKVIAGDSLLMEPINLSLPKMEVKSGGGGGGGTKAPTPASKGVLPKASDKQFVPPTPIITQAQPYLTAEPTIIAPQLASLLPVTDLLHMGDPNGVVGPPSAGTGTGGGIGSGTGHGVGTGDGAGAGPGSGGGFGGGIYHVGGTGGASAPTCPVQPEPNYSDDARKAHIQGTVILDSIIQKDGSIDVTKVDRSLGYGLDDEAKKVLKKWKCNPGKVNGQAVAVQLQIVINFHLY